MRHRRPKVRQPNPVHSFKECSMKKITIAGAGKIVKTRNTRLATYTLAESQEKIIPLER